MSSNFIHCSYHKCLTVYYSRVMSTLYNRFLRFTGGYKHFNSLLGDFRQERYQYRVASINNHALRSEDLGENFKITRFIRDPRDLIISGYFYHKRGAESWSTIVDPQEEDWRVVNGCVPPVVNSGHSFSSYLQTASKEDGLIAEIDFRKKHFTSMREWPTSDSRIKVFRYEDIIGDESRVFSEVFSHYGVSLPEKMLGSVLASRFSASGKKSEKTRHIRNPSSGQWKEHFSPRVNDYFTQQYADVLERYGYLEGN